VKEPISFFYGINLSVSLLKCRRIHENADEFGEMLSILVKCSQKNRIALKFSEMLSKKSKCSQLW